MVTADDKMSLGTECVSACVIMSVNECSSPCSKTHIVRHWFPLNFPTNPPRMSVSGHVSVPAVPATLSIVTVSMATCDWLSYHDEMAFSTEDSEFGGGERESDRREGREGGREGARERGSEGARERGSEGAREGTGRRGEGRGWVLTSRRC